MQIIGLIVAFCWLAFIIVWAISGAFAKKSLNKANLLAIRMYFLAIVLIVVFFLKNFFPGFLNIFTINLGLTAGIIGVILCVFGIGFAMWARFHLGRNWGQPMSVKEDRELITSGPYQYVRHPIYTGMFFALLGSGLATNIGWSIILVVAMIYFFVSAKREEKMLLKEFPHEYAEYMKRTKMIIPFIY